MLRTSLLVPFSRQGLPDNNAAQRSIIARQRSAVCSTSTRIGGHLGQAGTATPCCGPGCTAAFPGGLSSSTPTPRSITFWKAGGSSVSDTGWKAGGTVGTGWQVGGTAAFLGGCGWCSFAPSPTGSKAGGTFRARWEFGATA